MYKTTVRIHKVTIENFMNIEKGEITFQDKDSLLNGTPDILGIYGQNGSGKTAFIYVLKLLKYLLMGQPIPERFVGYLSNYNAPCHISFEFFVIDRSKNNFNVFYDCWLEKGFDVNQEKVSDSENEFLNEKNVVFIVREKIEYSGQINNQSRTKQTLLDTNAENVAFRPYPKFINLTKRNPKISNDIIVVKQLVREKHCSFAFSRNFLNIVQNLMNRSDDNLNDITAVFQIVLFSLSNFGVSHLHVIDTLSIGLINMNAALSFSFRTSSAIGRIPIKLVGSSLIPEDTHGIVLQIISDMNSVLSHIIPGLTIELFNLGTDLMKDTTKGVRVELVSVRKNLKIPLAYESEGIKKLISILHTLIVVYNDPSMTVAIDELDAGIFEYLLGELLKIISSTGKGQLIFTSHNLRPLETIDDRFIVFTTTNPKNRYLRIDAIQAHNNLRKTYYRGIQLDNQEEQLYEPTHNYEIELALKMAGEEDGEEC